jgi:nucleotide sugar dehydrogenase
MKVTVVGAGKMGLPLACQLAGRGAQVTACDVNARLVGEINQGRAPFEEPELADRLAQAVRAGALRASTDVRAQAAESDVVIVIVPALLTDERRADLSTLVSVARELAVSLKAGALVSFETTVPVGATRNVLCAALESGGRRAGRDFELAFSPERVKSQRVFDHLTRNPKVVGGHTPAAAERAATFYGQYLGAPVMNVGTLEAAEMVKLAGMIYRDINIAVANELARYAEAAGVDLTTLLPAINSDGEAAVLQAGIGVGGHCTPVYPYFMIGEGERIGAPMTLAERSRRINDGQAAWMLDRVERATGPLRGRRALILGLAFRPQVKEHICSTAFLLRDELRARGAQPLLHDPLYSDDELRAHGFEPARLDRALPEVVILQTAHREFAALDFARLHASGVRVLVDGRNLWSPEKVRAAGLRYLGVGRPDERGERAEPMLPVARPLLGGDEAEDAAQVVRSGWVLQGPQVAAFEREWMAAFEAPAACAVSSGTAALHLALLALGIGAGDEVITVSHSYVATANSVRLCGASPVFVDVDRSLNIDPELVEAAIGPRTRALLVVHQLGMPCDLGRLRAIAAQHGLPLVEDAACAAGSEIRWPTDGGAWQRIGRPHGDVACFSFHPRKLLTTGDGGMVVGRPELIERVRLLRQHGMATPSSPASVVAFNYRLTDVQAAIGRRQLQRLPAMVAERRAQAAHYAALLAERVPQVAAPSEPAWARSNWQSYCVILPDGVEAAPLLPRLAAKGISAREGVMNAHEQPAYRESHGALHLPVSVAMRARGLILPLFPAMTARDRERVVDALRDQLAR